MKLLWSALLVLGILSQAIGQFDDKLHEDHITSNLEQEALDRVVTESLNDVIKRFSEALALADTTLKRRNDMDGFLALQHLKGVLDKAPNSTLFSPYRRV